MDNQKFENVEAENIFFNNVDNNKINQSHFDTNNNVSNSEPSVWVFGYGSICWFPGFEYEKCVVGYIRGYIRRFWQGNVTHRGVPNKPGRVATIVESKEGITWGCAYKITGDTALKYLNQRECNLGGYVTMDTKFYPRLASEFAVDCEAFPVTLYVANEKNPYWLGDTSLNSIAEQIVDSSGATGHNVEYLIRLANFMREELPEVSDDHLFELERRTLELLDRKEIPLVTVMGTEPAKVRRDLPEVNRPLTFEYTSRVPRTKLRCLNI